MMKEKKISSIELWRFIFTIAIAIGHLNAIIWSKEDVNLLFNNYRFLAFFMFLSGYFLMSHYQKNKDMGEASTAAWKYTKNKISALYPMLRDNIIMIVCYIFHHICLLIIIQKTMKKDYNYIVMEF